MLSAELSAALTAMGVLPKAAAAWPTRESVAMAAMIPKITSSGERPLTLFRAAARIMATLACRVLGGLLVAAGTWAMPCGASSCEHYLAIMRDLAGVLIDLQKALELVDRGKLVEVAAATGSPCDALAWELGMCAWLGGSSTAGV